MTSPHQCEREIDARRHPSRRDERPVPYVDQIGLDLRYLCNLPSVELIRRVNRGTPASSPNRVWGSDAAEGRAFIEANLDGLGVNVEPFDAVAKCYWEKRRIAPPGAG
jgi:hypothetical protein